MCLAWTAACDGGSRDRPHIRLERQEGQPLAARAPRRDRLADAGASTAAALVPVAGDGYEGWIRPPVGPGHWLPAAADIAELEARVPAAVQDATTRGELPPAIDVTGHARQYAGYLRNDSRIIEVHFFCPEARNLARQIIGVRGGGDCLVHTAYDTGAKSFRYWRVSRQQ